MLPLTGEGMWEEERHCKRHRLKQSKAFQSACGVVPRLLDMLCSKGLARTQLLNPDARTALKPDNTYSSIREVETEGSLELHVHRNLIC